MKTLVTKKYLRQEYLKNINKPTLNERNALIVIWAITMVFIIGKLYGN